MHVLTRVAAICAMLITSLVCADELTVDDPAPPLALSVWLKGQPIERFEPGHVYVVEFWATWCGPCIAGMPKLSELQRRYRDDVTVIGVNIWEQEPDAVPAWMTSRGNALMDYAVAMQRDTEMADRWMIAAGERGIPAAFIIGRNGRIAWIGHPERLGEPLHAVVAGTWDIDAARQRRETQRAIAREREAQNRRFQESARDEVARFRNARSAEEAVPAAEALLLLNPPAELAMAYFDQAFFRTSFELKDAARAMDLAAKHRELLLAGTVDELTRYASVMLDIDVFQPVRDMSLVVDLVDRAHALDRENAQIAALCARAHLERAVELQRRAAKIAEGTAQEEALKTLARYERAQATSEQSP